MEELSEGRSRRQKRWLRQRWLGKQIRKRGEGTDWREKKISRGKRGKNGRSFLVVREEQKVEGKKGHWSDILEEGVLV